MDTPSKCVIDAEHSKNTSARHYVIDSRKSRFTVQAFATGVLSAMGHNPTIGIRVFRGAFDFDAEALEAHNLNLTVQSGSLGVLDDVSAKDRREMETLMKNDVLDVERFQEIRYDSSDIVVNRIDQAMYTAAVNGDLDFHGVSRKQSFSVRITMLGAMLRGSGEFLLKQSDFQIKPVSIAGGILKLKDELKFSFEMVAHHQEETG